jgi:hypothetical protein
MRGGEPDLEQFGMRPFGIERRSGSSVPVVAWRSISSTEREVSSTEREVALERLDEREWDLV